MSGAEAIVVVQLIDACIGITQAIIKIGEAAKNAQGLPIDLAGLFEEFTTVRNLFERARDNTNNVSEEARKSARPVLKHCQEALEGLQAVFEQVCPRDDANHMERIWKSTRASVLGKNNKLQKLWNKVLVDLDLLEKEQILDLGDKLDKLNGKVDSLVENEETSKVLHQGSGPLNNNENGDQFNQGGGEHNTFTQNNHGKDAEMNNADTITIGRRGNVLDG